MENNQLPLPKHSPNENVWDALEQELNRDLLAGKLPSYIPKDSTWNSIENHLKTTNPLQQLPTHSPLPEVWDKIAKKQSNQKTFSFYNWLKVAASVIVILGITYTLKLLNNSVDSDSGLVYSEVWISPIQPEMWDLESDQTIKTLIEKKESENPFLLKSSEYLELKSEFENLVVSKRAILEELTPYNDNVELELLLTKIELEKNSLVRNLISYSHV